VEFLICNGYEEAKKVMLTVKGLGHVVLFIKQVVKQAQGRL